MFSRGLFSNLLSHSLEMSEIITESCEWKPDQAPVFSRCSFLQLPLGVTNEPRVTDYTHTSIQSVTTDWHSGFSTAWWEWTVFQSSSCFNAAVSSLISHSARSHSAVFKELAQLFSARPPSSSFSLTYLLTRGTSGGGITDQMILSLPHCLTVLPHTLQ